MITIVTKKRLDGSLSSIVVDNEDGTFTETIYNEDEVAISSTTFNAPVVLEEPGPSIEELQAQIAALTAIIEGGQ